MLVDSPKKWINGMGFRQLLVLTFSIGIFLLALVSTLVTSSLSSGSIKERLSQEGLSLASTFAERSRVALLYQSQIDAKYVSEAMMAFPDIRAVSMISDNKELLFAGGEDDAPLKEMEIWPTEPALVLENDHAWYFSAPVYTGGQEEDSSPFLSVQTEPELIGFVRIMMGKATLQRMESDIFRYNFIATTVLAVILLVILLAITNRITMPMRNLAQTMNRAKKGEKDVRAEVTGTKDIIVMETAFNAMMDALKTRENELRSTRDMALEAARIKGEFAANVSHELRTPLNGVLGMLELLTDMGLSAKQQEYIGIATGSAQSLLELIDDILDFSKIDSGKLDIDQESFDLCALLEEIVLLLSTQASRKDIDFAYLVDSGVPDTVVGDKGRIRQVLINLVGNALKFTEQGDVGIEVSLDKQEDQQIHLKFEVWDTGIGMSEDVTEKIFEAFSQADGSTTRKYGGTGLGLAISRQLVNVLGGDIRVTSELGKGSKFFFTLPLGCSEKRSTAKPSISKNVKLLVVDDGQLSLRFLAQQLDRFGVEYDAATDGANALEKLRKEAAGDRPYDIVLVDQAMRGMAGEDFAHLIASDPAVINTRIVMMVQRGNDGYELGNNLPVSGFLSKPIQRSELTAILNGLMTAPMPGSHSTKATVDKKSAASAKVTSFSGSEILIVEDNRANQQVALGMLERLGCRSTVANNGKEALELVARKRFDLVLMDCHMPEMDGYEATAQIRQLEAGVANIPIIAMTANVQKGESEKCLAVGMNEYLAKPLKLDKLREKLAGWLDVKEYSVSERESNSTAVNIDSSIIDRKVFAELGRQIGDALPTMIRVFLDDLPDYVRSLKDAASVRDANACADIAHSIKGTASSLGASRLTEVCNSLEADGRSNRLDNIDELMQQVIDECGLLRQALEQEFSNKPNEATVATESSKEDQDNDDILDDVANEQRILIVDDDRGMRFAMRKVLENDGYRVDEVSNGEQALMYCERFMPDLVLMDAIMPEMDGFKACAEIQAMPLGKATPVLIITALNDELSIGRAFAAGAADYISKPVNFAVLRKRIARMLQASQAEKHVRQLAYNDTLTGLPNRALFTSQLNDMISEQEGEGMTAVLFLDLDRFKLVNDTFGHDAGDLLLKVVAERLQGCIRQGDVVSRFGGDEFTIALKRVKSSNVVKGIVEKIYEVLSRPFVFLGKEMHVSTSIGISMSPGDGKDIGVLLKNADIAMYRAKGQGNRYEFYDKTMEADVARRLGVESDLRGAIARGELVVYYQPQEDLENGELIGMEALVRWQHPVRGLMGPLEFIPLAEETGQILELGDWVLKTACTQMKRWLDDGYQPCRMAVNLAGRQLDNGDIVERVSEVLKATGLPAELLELEITESTIMENAEEVISTLERLKSMGVKLAVDDFGTGYSSLNYLKRFPIHMLKIDRAFVSDITSDKVDADIVSTIITLAHSLGVKVIAEGVELEIQKQLLKEQGCDYIQGYFLGKPVPAEDFCKEFMRMNSAA